MLRFRPPLSRLLQASALALGCALVALPAQAERADRDQPMHIESDALRYEAQAQRSIFTGNVVVTKGSIVMHGGRLEVTQDAAGSQDAVMTAAPGARATFRQKREGADEYIEGEGEKIDYDGKTDVVRFIGDAEARRLVGATVADDIRGSVITYNNVTEVYTVDSTGGGGKSAGSGRVRATFAPRGGAPGAQQTPGAGALPLAPSKRLGGGAQR